MKDKMTDAELSKKLGRYQLAESIGMLLGVLCVGVGWYKSWRSLRITARLAGLSCAEVS